MADRASKKRSRAAGAAWAARTPLVCSIPRSASQMAASAGGPGPPRPAPAGRDPWRSRAENPPSSARRSRRTPASRPCGPSRPCGQMARPAPEGATRPRARTPARVRAAPAWRCPGARGRAGRARGATRPRRARGGSTRIAIPGGRGLRPRESGGRCAALSWPRILLRCPQPSPAGSPLPSAPHPPRGCFSAWHGIEMCGKTGHRREK